MGVGEVAEDEKAVEVVAAVGVEAEAEVEVEEENKTKMKADVFPSLGGVPPSLRLEAKEKGGGGGGKCVGSSSSVNVVGNDFNCCY